MIDINPTEKRRRAAAQLLKKQKQQEFKSALAVHLKKVREIDEGRGKPRKPKDSEPS